MSLIFRKPVTSIKQSHILNGHLIFSPAIENTLRKPNFKMIEFYFGERGELLPFFLFIIL
jgi:hypothetical protein